MWTQISGTMPASSQASRALSTASLTVVSSALRGLSNPSRWRFLAKNSLTEMSRCLAAMISAVARRRGFPLEGGKSSASGGDGRLGRPLGLDSTGPPSAVGIPVSHVLDLPKLVLLDPPRFHSGAREHHAREETAGRRAGWMLRIIAIRRGFSQPAFVLPVATRVLFGVTLKLKAHSFGLPGREILVVVWYPIMPPESSDTCCYASTAVALQTGRGGLTDPSSSSVRTRAPTSTCPTHRCLCPGPPFDPTMALDPTCRRSSCPHARRSVSMLRIFGNTTLFAAALLIAACLCANSPAPRCRSGTWRDCSRPKGAGPAEEPCYGSIARSGELPGPALTASRAVLQLLRPGTCGGVPAEMYLAPQPVPAYVGHTYFTYQPMMPHELLYQHHRTYYRHYDEGRGLTRTRRVLVPVRS